MTKIYVHVAGQTLGSHTDFVKKLTKRKRAKIVKSPEESDWTIVFCPIVSRYQTDIEAALSSVPGEACGRKLVLVAMHHSFDKDYVFPRTGEVCSGVDFKADCLFYDKKGLYKCPSNKKAVKMVRKKLKLKKRLVLFKWWKKTKS
ncbi:uncharacterized protein ACO6RY_16400 [Pungitius sinensis]